jgi:hypothetical protein
MIHTVHFDDNYLDVRKLLDEIRCFKQGVHFESNAIENIVPHGYMTGGEFRKRAIVKVNTFCDEHGIL